jgi:hypothetical protein
LYKKVSALKRLPTIRRSITITIILTNILNFPNFNVKLCDPIIDYANI